MKKVIGILAVVAFASSMASAQLLKNVKYNGSIEVKSVTIGNLGTTNFDADKKFKHSETMPRVTVGINGDLTDDVNAQITAVKENRDYGNAGENLNNIQPSIMFTEAYVNLKNVIGINHKLGRQYYGNPGDIVIYYGPTSSDIASFNVQALDAWYGEWKKDKLTVTALMGKVQEGSQTLMRDKDVYGVTGTYDYSEIVKPSVYVYQLDNRLGSAKSDKVNVAGVKATGKYQGVGYGVEFAMDSGNTGTTDLDYTGNAMKANVDYALDAKDAGKFDFAGEYAMGSGNKLVAAGVTATKTERFKAINNNYTPGLLFGGVGVGALNDGLGNLTCYNVGVNWVPVKLNKLTVGAKYYGFAYTEKLVAGGDTPIGNELDFTAMWKHSDSVGLRASYALFTPDKKFAESLSVVGAKTDAASLLGFDLAVKF